MQLRHYLSLFRKYIPLLVILAALGAGSAYYYSLRIPPSYRAEVILLINSSQQAPATYYDPAVYSTNLAQAYTLLVTQQPILEQAATDLNWKAGWQDLFFHVSASASGNQLIQIAAVDRDPHQAKLIADAVAAQVVQQSPASQQRAKVEQDRARIQTRLDELDQQLKKGIERRDELDKLAQLESDPTRKKDLDAQLSTLQDHIDEWQKTYASLVPQLPNVPTNDLTILARAQEPQAPFSPNIAQNVIVAGLGGLLVAIALAFLFEYLDDTIKSSEDTQEVLGLPTLGTIGRIGGHHAADRLVTWKQPRSPIAEAYRVLRTNLRYSGIENPSGLLLVTSARPREGKTTTAANLAITLAQSGKHVILVDADLRRPSVDQAFGLPNSVGLSDLFLGDSATIQSVMQHAAVEGLNIITSGQIPPNPSELLDSKRMTDVLQELRSQADLVILDSPPVLAVADTSILSSRCSGVLLVVDPRMSRNDVCRQAVGVLKQSKARLLGVVLNRLGRRRGDGYYYEDSYYYYSPGKPARKGQRKETRESRPQAHA